MKRKFLKSLTAALFTILLIGCGGGGSGGNTISGVVKNFKTGTNLPGVHVTAGSHSATSGTDGSFKLTGVAAGDRIVVTFQKEGFVTTGKISKLSADITSDNLQVNMVPVAASGTLDPSSANSLKKAGETWQVDLEANALDASGQVKWEATPIDPARMGIDTMPGDMTTTGEKPIQSFGALSVTFKDASGNKVNLASGEQATIRIPLSSRDTGGATTPPATIPLYYYDEASGYWKQEGTATLKGTAPNQYYEGTVEHFSTWNADQVYDTIAIHGCVVDENNQSVANVRITMEGVTYNGTDQSFSTSDGTFTVQAKKSETSIVVGQKDTKVTNTYKAENFKTSNDVTMDECLVLGDAPFTARLTWGLNPNDLDTHVVGPDGPSDYHIFYAHQGSLTGEEGSNLDVDDVSSYGPEIYTAIKLPKAGTYHYAVYHYAGSSTIAASPARVEVMLGGDKTVFVADGNHTEKWWKVFDFSVNDDGKVTHITPINQWVADTGWPTD